MHEVNKTVQSSRRPVPPTLFFKHSFFIHDDQFHLASQMQPVAGRRLCRGKNKGPVSPSDLGSAEGETVEMSRGGSLPAFFLAGHSVLDKRNPHSHQLPGQTCSSPLNKTSIRGRCFSAAATASLAVPASLRPCPRLSLRDTHGSLGDRPSLGSGFHLCRSCTQL